MFTISSVEELWELNPFIVVGCGGGGEKFASFEGVETVGFVDDDPKKQGKKFCGLKIHSSLEYLLKTTDAKSVAIMLPIGAEASALRYAVQAIEHGKNVVTSFRSLPLSENPSLVKLAQERNVVIKEISPRLDNVKKIFGVAPSKCTEVLPKITYKHKSPVVYVGGTSQECGKRTTTRLLGKEAKKRGINAAVISTDEMGIERDIDFNFRAGSLSAMDVASAVMGAIKYIEEKKDPDIIFVESQASLTERGNPHPRGLSASILIGSSPDVTVLCHRPNHPFRKPRGIKDEIRAIEALEPTKVIAISLNLRNIVKKEDLIQKYKERYNLPVFDVKNDGASELLDIILEYIGGSNEKIN
ncbi:protein of unknown function DUF1611 [Methanothermus fervidus DSM 2088]|uniref:DUF1611 domain-containing protein n=1 Tax=Methanothermus fervidus (strain ATCC 43054 / DSM 2088 / JCM 10308 / V24 S) TaxID=523846 RepID=E3GXS5_METFV|nr:DUF1611 domain-containing protein [Methanothermus fervidus]ADP77107.1 protein of unknown function DUF1611 [Methanothermus fervidus DSM 2088]